jgi:hypothetical protein
MPLRMVHLGVALLVGPAAYFGVPAKRVVYASDLLVARLDLNHPERHLSERRREEGRE